MIYSAGHAKSWISEKFSGKQQFQDQHMLFTGIIQTVTVARSMKSKHLFTKCLYKTSLKLQLNLIRALLRTFYLSSEMNKKKEAKFSCSYPCKGTVQFKGILDIRGPQILAF
jgi:hypothetical protein